MFELATSYRGKKLREIAFPLGGIGTGTVSLTGIGGLAEWQIRNRPDQDSINEHTFFSIWACKGDTAPVTRVLEGPVPPPYNRHQRSVNGGFYPGGGLGNAGVPGLPRVDSSTFHGAYPFAAVDYHDAQLPVAVRLVAYNPMIPMNPDDSAIPCALFRFSVRNPTRSVVSLTLAMSMRNMTGPLRARPRNRFFRRNGLVGIAFDSPVGDSASPEHGTMVMATPWRDVTHRTAWYRLDWFDPLQSMWDEFSRTGTLADNVYRSAPTVRPDAATLGLRARIEPGETVELPIWVCWSFPTYEFPFGEVNAAGHGQTAVKRPRWRNHYAERFPTAMHVARYLRRHEPRLYEQTVRFREALDRSTVDRAIVHAATSQMSILRSPTCLRLEDGTFYGFEGSHVDVGSCPGSCTHVWNYGQTLPYLYPTLQQSMHAQNYRYNFSPSGSGAMAFRIPMPPRPPAKVPLPAVDGQMGEIVKIVQAWRITGDTEWLRSLWPSMKRSLDFAGGYWDWRGRGVIEGIAHNTYDIDFSGPDCFGTGYYLAALEACATVADFFDEPKTARRYRQLARWGARFVDRRLWNGEYYCQRVDKDAYKHSEVPRPRPRREIAAMKPGEPKYQYGSGCLSDQLVGVWQARVAGLATPLELEHVRTALKSIYHNNFKSDLRGHANCQRAFALQDEAALVLCSWPKGGRPALPFIYCDEAWTGIEYQVASHLIYEGMRREGMTIVRAIERRHDGERRNPWNHFEAGSYYARATAAWSVYLAATGFMCDAPAGLMEFRADRCRLRCFWSAQRAWGTFACGDGRAELHVTYGHLSLRALRVANMALEPCVWVNGRRVGAAARDAAVHLDSRMRLREGDILVIGRNVRRPKKRKTSRK